MSDQPGLLSIQQYAEHRKALGLTGGTHQAVRKAIKAGRIAADAANRIDPALADKDWADKSSPGKRESGAAGGQAAQLRHGKVPVAPVAAAAAAPPVKPSRRRPRPATAPPPDTGEDGEAGIDAGIDPETGLRTFNASRAQKEHYAAEKARLEFLQLDGTLVPADDVRREAARAARMVKDALLALPDRLCGELAALTDPHAVFVKLREEVTAALASLAESLPIPGDAGAGGESPRGDSAD